MEPEQKEALKKVFAERIDLYARAVFKSHTEYQTPEFHKEIYKLYIKGSKRIAIAVPRGHAKSTITNLVYLSWCIAYNKAKFIVIVSDSYSQAVLFLESLKDELEYNETYRALYGNQKTAKWAEGDIETTGGVKVIAKGQGMKLRGLKYRNTRPDLIVLDDIENEEQVQSKERREKLERWFNGTVAPSLASGGQIIIIGTVLHYASLLNTILQTNIYKNFEKRIYRVIEDGKPLWPELLDLEEIEALKEEYTNEGLLDLFMCEYMNNPVDPENQEFKREWFKKYETVDKKELRIYTAIDPAISEKEHADYSAIVTVGISRKNDWFILDVRRARMDPGRLIDEIFDVWSLWRPEKLGIETVAYQKAIMFFLTKAMKERNQFLQVEELKADTDKARRIKRLVPYYKTGSINHRANELELEEELLTFPKGRHDDILDALAYICDIAKVSRNRPKKLIKRKFQGMMTTY